MTQHVEVSRSGHVLEITLNKPKVNAIDQAMSRELGAAFALLRDDPELRVAILTATGERIFSAGWDLKALDAGDARLDSWWEDGDYGAGGMATNLDQFGPALKLPWTRLAAPELTPELRNRMVAGCDEMAGDGNFEDLAAERDRGIVAILKAIEGAKSGV